ncbi:MAG: endonuclease/exonuclease/phosphatase family protein [Prevotellaceae bacterium]|jgi:endonuclease/exonuclease/phosphatase family metal-dependent hydrolase|nr:endonuclease/exonuclease/phosphatase family protein [Prevotellaceae bacterium]
MKRLIYFLLIPLLFGSCNKPMELNVITFNIRMDYAGDSLNNWQYRKDAAAKIILNHNADILGAQEVLKNQLQDLKDRLPGYNSVGVGRDDGADKGEYSPLLYKKNRFTEEKSGAFWLSETPDVAGSMGWDAACTRIASWVILKDNSMGKRIFAINTHLDHMGLTARNESAHLLMRKIAELSEGLPVILTGDFNDTHGSDAIENITNPENKGRLTDSKTIAEKTSGTHWTFHGFAKVPVEERDRIDYIFVSKQIKVSEYEVATDTLNGVFVSDHKPVFVKLFVK